MTFSFSFYNVVITKLCCMNLEVHNYYKWSRILLKKGKGSCLASHETACLLRNQKEHYCFHNSSLLDLILSQTDSVHTSYPISVRSSLLPFRCSDQNVTCISYLSLSCYTLAHHEVSQISL
jgi:hypothetical protein